MPKFQVFITDFITDDMKPELGVLGDIAEITAIDVHSEAQLEGRIEGADAIMLYHNLSITKPTISKLKNCKLIVRCGVGYDNVDWRFARERGIPVANVPDYGTEEVADSAIGLALSLTRGINLYSTRLQRGIGPWSHAPAMPIYRLRGRVFAIIGLGCIGMAAALRAKALGMRVIFYDPYKPDGYDKAFGLERAESLKDLLKNAFIVSIHTPLTPETKHIINAESLAMMPKGSFLVNTARGGCIDLSIIPAALESGQLAGAAIDVLPEEPPKDNDPLLVAWRDPNHPAFHRLIVNPHAAFYSEEGLLDMRVKGSQACRRALLGEKMRNVVN